MNDLKAFIVLSVIVCVCVGVCHKGIEGELWINIESIN